MKPATGGADDGPGTVGGTAADEVRAGRIARSLPLRRTARVPLRRQLASGLAAAIRDGTLPGGVRLPGTRPLAAAMGVHRSTVAAAYGELRRVGLVRRAAGRGVYVVGPAAPYPPGEPGSVAGLVASARRSGRGAGDVVRELDLAIGALGSRRVLVVEPEPELRALLSVEVGRVVPGPVEACGPRALGRDPSRAAGRHVLARPAVARRLADVLPRWIAPFPLRCGGGTRELRTVRGLPSGAVVAVVTVSPAVRRHARALLSAAAPAVAAAAPRPDDAPGVERALRVARLVFADACCVREPRLRDHRRVVPFRVLRRDGARALRRWLRPAGPRHDGRGAWSDRVGSGAAGRDDPRGDDRATP